MVLDRASGAILKTSGQVASIRKPKPLGSALPTQTAAGSSFPSDAGVGASGQDQAVEELAVMVWNFISTAGGLVQELDTEVWFTNSSTQGKHEGRRPRLTRAG